MSLHLKMEPTTPPPDPGRWDWLWAILVTLGFYTALLTWLIIR